MNFRPFQLRHGKRAQWSAVTHVRLTGVPADTPQGQRVLDHIAEQADEEGIAAIARIEPGFPARQAHLGARRAMEVDLRHMANQRDAGESQQNKGLLELGRLV